MNAERDYLVQFIFPRLSDYCRSRHLEFVPIDLRWGIPEEDSRNGLVLSACMEEIDNSRPFFIGILGSRYGWQPSQEDLDELPPSLEQLKPWFGDAMRSSCSITELEIEYGVLRKMDIPYASFFIRDESVEVPAEYREPSGSIAEHRLKVLKVRLHSQSKYPVLDYSSPEDLGRMVYDQVLSMIDREYPASADDWYDSIAGVHRHALEMNGRTAPDPENLWKLFEHHVAAHTGVLFFAGSAGTENLHTLAYVTRRLSEEYEYVHYFDFEYAPEDMSPVDAFLQWADTELKPLEKPARCYVSIDHCSLLSVEEAGRLSDWIGARPATMYVALAGAEHCPVYHAVLWRFAPEEIKCNGLSDSDRRLFVENFMQRYGKRLSASQLDMICSGRHTQDPSVLELLCRELVNFGSMEGLDYRIAELLESQDTNPAFLLWNLISEYSKRFARYRMSSVYARAMSVLSIAHEGVSEQDIMKICGVSQSVWSTVRPYVLQFCKRCGSLLSYTFSSWSSMVVNIWSTVERAEIAYEMTRFYLKNLRSGRIDHYTVSRINDTFHEFVFMPNEDSRYAGKCDGLFREVHAASLSPDVVRIISSHDLSSLWSMLKFHGKLNMSDEPGQVFGRPVGLLSHTEAVAYYRRLGDIAAELEYADDAFWAYRNLAELKRAASDQEYLLSEAQALMSVGKIHRALEILGVYDKSVRKPGLRGILGTAYSCSDESLLRYAILRCRVVAASGRHEEAAAGLLRIVEKCSSGLLSESFVEAVSLVRCLAMEHGLGEKYFNLKIFFKPEFVAAARELPLTSMALVLFYKANMLTCLRNREFKKAKVWAEWYWHIVYYGEGSAIALQHAQIYCAYAQMMADGKQHAIRNARVGRLVMKFYRDTRFVNVDEMDIGYRREWLAEAGYFRNMLTTIENMQYRQYKQTMPQRQCEEEQAELDAYRLTLKL